MHPGPSPQVLDLFAVPDEVVPLPGGQGRSVRAGDLVLSPDRDPAVCDWLYPLLARLAIRLEERPGRARGDLRIAVPVPARDGSWVIDGWAACRFELGSIPCRDLDVLVAAGRVLHAELATAVSVQPAVLIDRDDRWAVADRLAFGRGEDAVTFAVRRADPGLADLVTRLVEALVCAPVGPDQLVHADLAGNVLMDAWGAPVVIDVAPCWRPARWAEAVCVLDAVMWGGASSTVLARWSCGAEREAMIRAALFRVLSDRPCDVAAYASVLGGAIIQ